jgi:RHS repeat-associated protein
LLRGLCGNLLDDGVRTYTYDHANRLVAVVSGTLTTTFVYNGDGHRVAKAVDGVTTTYVVAVLGLSQVLAETTDGETIRYVFGHDLLAEESDGGWAWHLGDGLGSVRQLADSSGRVTLVQGYAPFGEPLWSEGSGSTGFGFTGEQWEAYAQLLFLRARYYEPWTGRFVSKDPWAGDYYRPPTLDPYAYVADNLPFA